MRAPPRRAVAQVRRSSGATSYYSAHHELRRTTWGCCVALTLGPSSRSRSSSMSSSSSPMSLKPSPLAEAELRGRCAMRRSEASTRRLYMFPGRRSHACAASPKNPRLGVACGPWGGGGVAPPLPCLGGGAAVKGESAQAWRCWSRRHVKPRAPADLRGRCYTLEVPGHAPREWGRAVAAAGADRQVLVVANMASSAFSTPRRRRPVCCCGTAWISQHGSGAAEIGLRKHTQAVRRARSLSADSSL